MPNSLQDVHTQAHTAISALVGQPHTTAGCGVCGGPLAFHDLNLVSHIASHWLVLDLRINSRLLCRPAPLVHDTHGGPILAAVPCTLSPHQPVGCSPFCHTTPSYSTTATIWLLWSSMMVLCDRTCMRFLGVGFAPPSLNPLFHILHLVSHWLVLDLPINPEPVHSPEQAAGQPHLECNPAPVPPHHCRVWPEVRLHLARQAP
jgi:hypothetical protein